MSYDSEVLADSPITYLKLGESSGTTANDASGNGHNGTYVGGVTLGQSSINSGDTDTCILLDGTTGYVDLGNPAALQLSGAFTIELMLAGIYPSTGGFSVMSLAGKGFDGAIQSILRLFMSPPVAGTAQLEIYNGTEYQVSQNFSWPTGEAHILTVLFNGTLSKYQLYIDGILVAETSGGPGFLNTSKNFTLGAEAQGSIVNYFKGKLKKLSVYSSGLSASRVHAHAVAAGFASAAVTMSSLVVDTTGSFITATFSEDPLTVSPGDIIITSAGRQVRYTVSGTGVTRTLTVIGALIEKSEVVKGSYVGIAVTNTVLTATNGTGIQPGASNYYLSQMSGFAHWSSETYGGNAISQSSMNTLFNPTGFNIAQIVATFKAAGCARIFLTTKHDGWCLFPNSSGAPHLGLTPWYISTGIDIVRAFVVECRLQGVQPCLYINFYDPWYTSGRPGHDGTYTPKSTYLAYMWSQIDPLLTNYGEIYAIWVDSITQAPTYTNAPWAEVRDHIRALQPNIIIVNNDNTGTISASDVATLEQPAGHDVPTTDLIPQEYCMTVYEDDFDYIWTSPASEVYKDPYVVANIFKRCIEKRTVLLLNFPVTTDGVLPASQVTWANSYATMVGVPGPTPLLLPDVVKAGVDRGDRIPGTYGGGGGGGGGINGTGILGMT